MAREQITVYDAETGRIKSWRHNLMGVEPIVLQEGEAWKLGYFDEGQVYIDPITEEPVPLKEFELVVTTNLVTGIPPGTWAIVDGVRVPAFIPGGPQSFIDDGELEIEVEFDHTAQVILQCPLYIHTVIEVPCEA